MHIIDGYTPKYCGKCHEGFISKLSPSMESILIPCECKIEQDSTFLYHELLAGADITLTDYLGKNFDNYMTWLPDFISDKFQEKNYELIYKKYLGNTSTKFVQPTKFNTWFFSGNISESSFNCAVFSVGNFTPYIEFYSNFLCHILIKRLVTAKVIEWNNPILIDRDSTYAKLVSFLEGKEVLILKNFLSKEMLTGLHNDFIYNKIQNFLNTLFYSINNRIRVFTVFGLNVSLIRELNFNDILVNDKLKHRANHLLDLVLNKSKTVILSPKGNEK